MYMDFLLTDSGAATKLNVILTAKRITPLSVQLTRPKNVASTLLHYSATAALAAASFAMGGPVGIAIAAAVTGGLSFWVLKEQKNHLENNLVKHPDVHKHSPNLGKMADELYKKTGLSETEHPIYDFRADKSKHEKKGFLAEVFEEVFDTMGHTHNAAALHLGKPVIMISEPLLKLLDDPEEKAVLAHEFAHAAAHHTKLGLPQKLLGGLAVATNSMTMIGAWWATGFKGIIAGIGAKIVASAAAAGAMMLFDKDKVLGKKDIWLDDEEESKKKKMTKAIKTVGSVASTLALTYFNPLYLGLWAASKTMAVANKLISSAYSRSMEYHADEGAVALGADPLALVTGLRKIEQVVKQSKEEYFGDRMPQKGELSKAWARATASHPPTEKRVARLVEMAEKQGISKAKINAAAYGAITVSNDHNMSYDVIKQLAHGM